MRNDATGRMILEVKQPLLDALKYLSSHSAEIHAAWRKLLQRYEPCSQYVALLSGMHLTPQVRDLRVRRPASLQGKVRTPGSGPGTRGVPAECAAVAVALYVESCLPYLMAADSGRAEWTKAFARWASIYQFFLLSGYAQHAAAERHSLEDKISRSERRSQDVFRPAWRRLREREAPLAQDLHDEIGR